MRVCAVFFCAVIPGLQTYLFRRVSKDLVKNHMEGPKGLRNMLAPWVDHGWVKIVEEEIRFWNGSKIYLCHCEHEKDMYKYQGAEIHMLLVDELTTFTEAIYRFLRGRTRAVGLAIPDEYKGLFPRIICGSNPGNVGHLWVKNTFIDGSPEMEIRRTSDDEGGMLRQYIPARLDDNPSMQQDDPTYRARLRGLGSEALVRAMELGDWDVIEGAYFDCWDAQKHVIRPFTPLPHWTRFRSLDWGSARPFSVGWWTILTEPYEHDGILLPKNALIRYREWYGCKKSLDGKSEPNVGLKMTAEDVAKGIVSRETSDPRDAKGKQIHDSVADPSIFAEDGGPSLAERMFTATGIVFRPADNRRVPDKGKMGGWDQLRARFIGEDGKPMIYCVSTCVDSIRTIPALQHDQNRPEDVDTDGEDHAGDDWRYAAMSRPYARPLPDRPEEMKGLDGVTMNRLWQEKERDRRRLG